MIKLMGELRMTDDTLRLDVNALRNPAIEMHRLRGVDSAYVFYYDETNNDRRLHVTEEGLNVPNPGCFVLGGIACRGGTPPILDLTGLRQAVRLQPSATELKLKHLGKGDFLQLIDEPKVGMFLDWIVNQPELFIHYIALDPLYWSTVDIIESIIANEDAPALFAIERQLKDDLFTVLSSDVRDMAGLFHRFSYPDVGNRRREFLEKVLYRLDRRRSKLDDASYHRLKNVLKTGRKARSLPFLEDEEPHTLIDSLVHFFIERICLFKNATHVFDVEETIRKRLEKCCFYDGTLKLDHYSFVDSKAEAGVQVSDALIGLLGKLITYASRTEPSQIRSDMQRLTDCQRHAIRQLNVLMDRSNDVSPAVFNNVLSNRAIAASGFILGA